MINCYFPCHQFIMDKEEVMTLKDAYISQKYEIGGHVDLATMEKRFIRKYKQLPHLWNPNHPDYNVKLKRNSGYDALMPIIRQYMPRATRFHIRQKINILRSCYRKERRKHLASRSIDAEGNVVYNYIPSTWKYEALRFLDDEVDNEIDMPEVDTCPEYEDEVEYVDAATESGNEDNDPSKLDITPIYLEEEHLDDDEDQKPFKRKRQRDFFDSFKLQYVDDDVLTKEFNAIGMNVACKLQRMSTQQRYHAELLINKVLIRGLKESLTDATDLTSSWSNTLEESLTYNNINSNKNEEYHIQINSKDSREESNIDDDISEDK